MPNSRYAAGFNFIVSTPSQSPEKGRKAIRIHARRARDSRPRRQAAQLRSWIDPHRELESELLRKTSDRARPYTGFLLPAPSPSRFGSDFSGLRLPSGVEPDMIQSLIKYIDLNNYVGYPYEICLRVHPAERGWFPYMISDILCVHSMMFSLQAFIEGASNNKLSHLASFHYAHTLRLLQNRLGEFDKTSAISDATIMTVITLATIAEIMKDFTNLETHIKGLARMVDLRGGLRSLNAHFNMQVKVARVELAYSLRFGHSPLLLKGEITWECFIADSGLVKCSHFPHDTTILTFAKNFLDVRLHNALRDLHAFSCMSNIAYQTTRKLSPELYNEMIISILYRLTYLSFEGDFLQETIRTGLLIFSSTIFMQRHFVEQPYEHLINLYSKSFLMLLDTDDDLPVPVFLWLTMLPYLVAQTEPASAGWRTTWLDKTIVRAGIDTWSQACEILRSVAWVGFIHDHMGRQAFELAMSRLKCEQPVMLRR